MLRPSHPACCFFSSAYWRCQVEFDKDEPVLLFDTKGHMDTQLFLQELAVALESIGCPLTVAQQQQLCLHWQLCGQWRAVMNLTTLYEPKEAAWLHVADSLLPVPYIQGEKWLDIGSGAGFPGIPLAIATPQVQWLLLEPRAKRCSFLKMVIFRLGLQNCQVLHGKLADLEPTALDGAVSRATFSDHSQFAPLSQWLGPEAHLWALVRPTRTMTGLVRQVQLLGRERALMQLDRATLERSSI